MIHENAIKEVDEMQDKGNILRVYRESVRAGIFVAIFNLTSWYAYLEAEQFGLAKRLFTNEQ